MFEIWKKCQIRPLTRANSEDVSGCPLIGKNSNEVPFTSNKVQLGPNVSYFAGYHYFGLSIHMYYFSNVVMN